MSQLTKFNYVLTQQSNADTIVRAMNFANRKRNFRGLVTPKPLHRISKALAHLIMSPTAPRTQILG